jgi:methylamine dehydrogenase accessory protein MauD
MDVALLLLRLVLAGVLAVAGFGKIAGRPATRATLVAFGVPASVVAPFAIALPLAELAVAALLLPLDTAWIAALGALVLMLLFSAGIAYNLAKGRRPDCNCFGAVHSEQIGPRTLVRNGAFALIAAVLALRGPDGQGASLTSWWDDLTGIEQALLAGNLLLLAAVAALGWLVLQMLRQQGRILLRLDAAESGAPAPVAAPSATPESGLPVGAVAPAFTLPDVHGVLQSLERLRKPGRSLVVIFSDPGCGPCNALMPEVGRWQREYADRLPVAVISRGDPAANRRKAEEHGLTTLLLQDDREVAQAYDVLPTPGAVLIRPDGTIGARAALGADAIRALVTRATAPPLPLAPANGHAPAPPASRIGQPAPEVTLPDLDGNEVSLASFRGEPALLVFWNPGCGFCQRMAGDLASWLATPPEGAPKVVLVSTGTPEANVAQGIPATTLLDQGFATGRAFGVSGTPSAVLVDAEGRIASDPAIGAPGIWALVGNPPAQAQAG